MNFNATSDVIVYVIVFVSIFLIGRIWGSWKSSLIIGALGNLFFYLYVTRFNFIYILLTGVVVIGGFLLNFIRKQATDEEFRQRVNADMERIQKKEDEKNALKELEKENRIQIECPNCQSTKINFVDNNGKQFSIGKALAGGFLVGGIGALAGFAGKKGKTNRWYCTNCGTSFTK